MEESQGSRVRVTFGREGVEEEKRMARAHEIQARLVDQAWKGESDVLRELRRGSEHVGESESRDGCLEARQDVGEERREPALNSEHFTRDLGLEHLEAIAQRHHDAWLDEQSRTAAARRVYDPWKPLVGVGA